MTATTPNPNAIDAALAMVKLNEWGAKGSLVSLVRLTTLGDPDVGRRGMVRLPRHQVEGFTGIDNRYAYRLLGELTDDRVLLRYLGGGTRASAYAINPEIGAWRNVPWRVARSQALFAIARVCADPSPATESPLAARHSAHLAPLAARLNRASQSGLLRDQGAQLAEPLLRDQGAQLASADDAPPPISGSSKEEPLSFGQGRKEEELRSGDDEGTRKVFAQLEQAGHRLWGSPAAAVRGAVSRVGVARAYEAARSVPAGLGPRGVERMFAELTEHQACPPPTPVSATWSADLPPRDPVAGAVGLAAAKEALSRGRTPPDPPAVSAG